MVNCFINITSYKINIQKPGAFRDTTSKQTEEKTHTPLEQHQK